MLLVFRQAGHAGSEDTTHPTRVLYKMNIHKTHLIQDWKIYSLPQSPAHALPRMLRLSLKIGAL